MFFPDSARVSERQARFTCLKMRKSHSRVSNVSRISTFARIDSQRGALSTLRQFVHPLIIRTAVYYIYCRGMQAKIEPRTAGIRCDICHKCRTFHDCDALSSSWSSVVVAGTIEDNYEFCCIGALQAWKIQDTRSRHATYSFPLQLSPYPPIKQN